MLLTVLFFFLLFGVFGKILSFSLRAAWGLTKIMLFVVFLPMILVILFFAGAAVLAFPLLLLIGMITLIKAVF